MRPRSIVEMVFVVICCIVATLFILSLVTCSTVTVITGTNGAVVSEEADKGVVIKPKKGSAE